MITKLILQIIRIYQKTLSPDTGWLAHRHPYGFCRFHPHCSEYGYLAVKKYGPVKGLLLLSKRLLKCHPFHPGGIDQLK